MKRCTSCAITVGGEAETCPLCQNLLSGEDSARNWPPIEKLKKQAFLYKLQLFIVLAAAVICLSLDFLMDLNDVKHHWSLPIAVAAIVVELAIRSFIKGSVNVAKIVNFSALYLAVLITLTSWYFGHLSPILHHVIPGMIVAVLITDVVLAFVDTKGNALVYLLLNILTGVVAYVVIMTGRYQRTIMWTVCLMLSVVAFIAMVVFRGRKVLSEIQKRMNL